MKWYSTLYQITFGTWSATLLWLTPPPRSAWQKKDLGRCPNPQGELFPLTPSIELPNPSILEGLPRRSAGSNGERLNKRQGWGTPVCQLLKFSLHCVDPFRYASQANSISLRFTVDRRHTCPPSPGEWADTYKTFPQPKNALKRKYGRLRGMCVYGCPSLCLNSH